MLIENRPTPHAHAFKGLLWDYDVVKAASDEECCYSLSQKEVKILLAIIDPIAWITRWTSPTDQLILQSDITAWNGNLARKLMSGCCDDELVLHRLTEGGALEISTDGGETWIPDPNDPRLTATQLPDTIPGEGSQKRCNAATNCLENVKQAQVSFSSHLETGKTLVGMALEFAGIVAALIFAPEAAPILIPILIGLAAGILTLTKIAYDAEFDADIWDQLLCDIFCTMGDDAQFTESEYNDLLALLDTDFHDNVALTFHAIFTGWGLIGTNNSLIAGAAATADCSDCECDETCGARYDILPPYSSPLYGTVIARTDTSIDVEIGTSGYGVIQSEDYNNCCRVAAIDQIVGSPVAGAHIPCGTPWSEGAFIFSSGLTACCATLLATGSEGDVIRYSFTDDC